MEDELNNPKEKHVVDVPKEKRHLSTASYDYSVQLLIDNMTGENPKIILEVPFQRSFIWKEDRASQLIESVIMNVPIPPLYFAEEENGKWLVIDGLQRLNSLKRYFENEYKLEGLEIITELGGIKYKDLQPKTKNLLLDGLLRVNVIKKDSHPDIKYDIFMRLNKGSVTLNYQELRNCLYRGSLNDEAREFSKTNKDFQKLLNLKKPHPRFLDVEFIMRLFAIEEKLKLDKAGLYEVEGYTGRMVNFVNDYMENTKKMTELLAVAKMTELSERVDKIVSVFGTNNPFKDESAKIKRFNRSIAELIFLSFYRFEHEDLIKNGAKIKKLMQDRLVSDEKFKNSISQNTSNTDVVNYRIDYWLKQVADAI